jgi:hypothetical protein
MIGVISWCCGISIVVAAAAAHLHIGDEKHGFKVNCVEENVGTKF